MTAVLSSTNTILWVASMSLRYAYGSKKPVLFFPGWTGTAYYFVNTAAGARAGRTFTEGLAEHGFATFSRNDGSLWGNATAMTETAQLKTNAQSAALGGIGAAGKVHLIGNSAGSLNALQYLKENPTLVQSCQCSLPMVDPQDIQTNDRGGIGVAASITAAHGGAIPDARTPIKNTATYASAGVPIRLYYSETDPICLPAKVTSFVSSCNVANIDAVSMGSVATGLPVGHDLAAPFDAGAVGKFITQND